jgi:glycosyltransferase involved in cell wall biosynthesis
MNNTPFFSILIPTKNRSKIISYAIKSVLSQNFKDFEIIIADNDDSEKTYRVISSFNDNRIKYYKTGGLNMAENWQTALLKASGKYITVLEDKHVYYPYALQAIYDIIFKHGSQIIVWDWDHYSEVEGVAYQHKRSCKLYNFSSDFILDQYVSSVADGCKNLPRMLNSCASHESIKQAISKSSNGSFFSEISPDLNAAFSLLSIENSVTVVEVSMGLGGFSNLSNARQVRINGYDYYGNMSNDLMFYTPIKSMKLTYNTVYNDFLKLKTYLNGTNLDRYAMSDLNYSKVCLWDTLRLYNSSKELQLFFDELMPILSFIRDSNLGIIKFTIPFSIFKVLIRSVINKFNAKYSSKRINVESIYIATQSPPLWQLSRIHKANK